MQLEGSNVFLNDLSRLLNKARGKRLSQDFFRKAKPELAVLCPIFELDELKTALFSALLLKAQRCNRVDLEELTGFFDLDESQELLLAEQLKELERRFYVFKSTGSNGVRYVVESELLRAVQNGAFKKPSFKLSSEMQLLLNVRHYYKLLGDEPAELFSILKALIGTNQDLPLAAKITKLDLKKIDFLVFMFLLFKYSDDCEHVRSSSLNDVLSDSDYYTFLNSIEEKESRLQMEKLIEFADHSSLISSNFSLKLTSKALKEYLPFLKREKEKPERRPKIQGKKLIYPLKLADEIAKLDGLLSAKGFTEVKKKLKERGLPPAVICLFYGDPGTGKTETVMQLARRSRRRVIRVELAAIRDMWVGNSEKNVQAIFDDYEEALKEERRAPILLFNEADGLIGKRFDSPQSAASQSENTMQNILLQNLEDFQGILIATTNLAGNLDPAFDRRFLFKLRFDKPDEAIRSQLWQQKIPSLTAEEAQLLGKSFAFSGGQIDNVVRRSLIEEILEKKERVDFERLLKLCTEEFVQRGDSAQHRRAGFCI